MCVEMRSELRKLPHRMSNVDLVCSKVARLSERGQIRVSPLGEPRVRLHPEWIREGCPTLDKAMRRPSRLRCLVREELLGPVTNRSNALTGRTLQPNGSCAERTHTAGSSARAWPREPQARHVPGHRPDRQPGARESPVPTP